MKGDPKYEIASAFPQFHTYYGLLVGIAYTFPYLITGLYAA
jgi:hypothetical protein